MMIEKSIRSDTSLFGVALWLSCLNLDGQTGRGRLYHGKGDLQSALSILQRALGRIVLKDAVDEMPPQTVEGRGEISPAAQDGDRLGQLYPGQTRRKSPLRCSGRF
jgi:hypothetical protein